MFEKKISPTLQMGPGVIENPFTNHRKVSEFFQKRPFFPFNIWLSFLNGIYILLGSFLKMVFDLYLIFCSHLLSSDICNNSICGGSRNSHKNLKRFFHLK